ncbi:MAG TPA: MATE family efflux transporter [Candidatus Ignatzschineria merdigallinarum]|uniref:Multidrug export protein MepA n=1 Tax=Candidatus Ignatzschineria merdigallinarum TaxID=2838621 RepID=A0A9D1Q562_9GAMM|nr:MATE family efflux transporter [Candidatus Ignatzschineria merdigallinarum]
MAKVDQLQELREAPIKKLLWKYALPAMVGSSVAALYNIITRYFVGNAEYLGDNALSAMGIALPVMTMIAAFGMLVGAGAGSRISIYLGNQDFDKAESVVGTSLLLTLIITLTVSYAMFIFLEPLVYLLGADELTYHYTYEFLQVFLPGAIFSNLCFSFNNMMRASGDPRKAMVTMLLTLVANTILAPIFILYLEWGLRGAAISIVLSMILGTIFVMEHFLNKKTLLRFRLSKIRLNFPIVKAVLSIGMSPFLMNIVSAAIIFLMIYQIREYGEALGVAVYTIANMTLMLVILLLLGLTQGMQPIVGYSYGARSFDRLREALLYTIKIGVVIGTVAMIVGVFFPAIVVRPFNPSEELAQATMKAIRIVTLLFPLVGFQMVVTIFFQSIGKVGHSIFLSLSRQIIFLIPALFILPSLFDSFGLKPLDGVWAAIPVSDFISAFTAMLFLWLQLKELKKMKARCEDLA